MEKLTDVKRDFSKEATTWETPPRIKLAQDVAGTLLQHVALTPEMDVLDFGCGTGLISLQLAPLVRSVIGLDSAVGMLEVLLDKVKRLAMPNVKTMALDLTAGATLVGPYHVIVSSMTLHHIQDVTKLFDKFYDALLPSGQIAIADLDEEDGRFHSNKDGVYHFGFSRQELERLLAKSGFQDIKFVTVATIQKPEVVGHNIFSLFLVTARKV